MSVNVSCVCGAAFAAQDHLIGSQVNCPACGSVLAIPAPQPQPMPAAGAGQKAVVACRSCGQRFQASVHLAGQQMPCPACGSTIALPHTAAAPAPMQLAASSIAGPTSSHMPQTRSAKPPDQRTRTLTAVAVVGGIVALMLVAAGVFWWALVPGTEEPAIAAAPQPAFEPAARPTRSRTQVSPSRVSPSRPRDSSPQDASPPSRPSIPIRTAPIPSSAPATDNDSPPSAVAEPSLPVGVQNWVSGSTPRVGARPVRDSEQLPEQYSWMCEMLPYLGHQSLYDRFSFREPWTDRRNLQLTGTLIPEFQTAHNSQQRWKGYPFDGMALSHFAGMSGPEERNVVAAALPRDDPRAGVFGYDHIARRDEITDGTSQTISIVESGDLAGPWVTGGGATVRGARRPYFGKVTGFGSRRTPSAGAVVAFADGSVRFISADIDPSVFQAMCTMHGADSVDPGALPPVLDRFPVRTSP